MPVGNVLSAVSVGMKAFNQSGCLVARPSHVTVVVNKERTIQLSAVMTHGTDIHTTDHWDELKQSADRHDRAGNIN